MRTDAAQSGATPTNSNCAPKGRLANSSIAKLTTLQMRRSDGLNDGAVLAVGAACGCAGRAFASEGLTPSPTAAGEGKSAGPAGLRHVALAPFLPSL